MLAAGVGERPGQTPLSLSSSLSFSPSPPPPPPTLSLPISLSQRPLVPTNASVGERPIVQAKP